MKFANIDEFAKEKVKNHRFINTIEMAKKNLNISDDVFNGWVMDVTTGFERKNYWALERRIVHTMDGVNPSCVLQELKNTQELTCHTNAEVLGLKRKLDEILRELAVTKKRVISLESVVDGMNSKLDLLLEQRIGMNQSESCMSV